MTKLKYLAAAAALLLLAGPLSADEGRKKVVSLTPGPEWKILSTFSGKVSYYRFVEEDGAKASFSKTPIGPFHTIVFAERMISE